MYKCDKHLTSTFPDPDYPGERVCIECMLDKIRDDIAITAAEIIVHQADLEARE